MSISCSLENAHPLDLVEEIVSAHEWRFQRPSHDELLVGLGGSHCDYQLWFSWRAMVRALHLSCGFDFRVSANRRQDVHSLLALVNEKVAVGHFGLWPDEGMVLYRHALLLRGESANSEQIETLVEIALCECERFYPAFQFLVWGGHKPEDALRAALVETVGRA
jgi:hypothetical protein